MGVKEKRLTEQFTAKSEDGRQFDLLVYTDILDVGTSQNPNATLEGIKTILTSDGYHVNRIDDLNYEIVELGLRVKKVR